MTGYLSYMFNDDEQFISTFDEAPLWSAAFGLLLFKHLELKPGITVVDIGSGAGFPLMELAGRLGSSCKLYGVDPWKNAMGRAREKLRNYGLTNVELLECSAENIPLTNGSVDLVVSNLGINNFDSPHIVFKECHRILKPGAKLALTTNINGHWKEFYGVFYQTLIQANRTDLVPVIEQDEAHRGTMQSISELFSENGFSVHRHFEDTFEMKFADGSAFLNHYFVKLGWLTSWMSILPKESLHDIFSLLEQNLNEHAMKNHGLTLTVPMAYIEGWKLE
jgi:arsenite methyltransferase